jgi:membrane protein DedA with SNARE-associated domain
MTQEYKHRSRRQFLIRNLLKGFGILALFVAVFIFIKKYVDLDFITWLEPIYSRPVLMFLIYTASEVFFGIIPPELFFVWGLTEGDGNNYIQIIAALALISYGAGWFAFYVGRRSHESKWFRYLRRRYFRKYDFYLQEYGSFLVIVAAVTPLPYSAVCMLVGSAGYKTKKFLLYSLFRLARYIVYAFVIWEANTL